jgi:hypothetical protein
MSHHVSYGELAQRVSARFRSVIVVCVAITLFAVTACASDQEQTNTPPPTEVPQLQITPSSTPPSPSDWTWQWLKGIPCHLPCWEGITPGQTTVSETLTLLENSPFITRARIQVSKLMPDDGYVFWDWVNGRSGGGAKFHAQTSDKVVYAIAPNFSERVHLQQVIDAFGEPTYVHAQAERNPDDTVSYVLRIVYRNQGILLQQAGVQKLDLRPDMTFEKIVFFEPTEQTLKDELGGAAAHPEWLLPWQGIKDFDFYCRDSENGKLCHGEP